MSKFYRQCCSLAILMLMSITTLFAQQTVTGTVTDVNGALAGVTVSVVDKSTSTQTDENGRYSITANRGDRLRFSMVGYLENEIVVSGNVHNVTLTTGDETLDEVVVTALGIKREAKSLGYAVQQLKGTELVEARETNITNAFTGKVAGLQVIRSSSGAGGSSKINLRGNTSLTGDNQPLIIVDGVPIDNFQGGNSDYWNATFDYGNGLMDINPDDIQSVSVLKGPSAAALYGSRAGNGVILITTKSGIQQPGLGITFTASLGTENIFMRPELQNSFGQGSNGIFNAESNTSWGPQITGQTVTKWDGSSVPLRAYDNVSTFLRPGVNQNYGLSLQQQYGGTGVYSSVNYTEDRSIIPNNKLTRFNFSTRATSNFGAEKRWTSDVKVSYNHTAGFNRPVNGRDRSSLYALYTLPLSMDIADFKSGINNPIDRKMLWYPGAPSHVPNPYWAAEYDLNSDSRNRFMMNGGLKYAFNDWLDFEVRAGADHYNTERDRRSYSGGSLNNGDGSYMTGKNSFTETNYSALLKGAKDNVLGNFGGSFTLGGNLMEQKFNALEINTGSLEVPDFFSPTNSKDSPTISPSASNKRINSIYGSFGVNYGGWIFADVTARNDWSSALIKEYQSYFYPSFSLSYVLTDHLNSVGGNVPVWLSYAKLRASHATVGNDMSPYNLYNGYTLGRDQLGHTTAQRETLLKNPLVKSELIKNLEFGAEFRFANNRFGLDLTWYKSNSTRQLIAIPMDPISGFGSRMLNTGNVQNKGFEIMANAGILVNPESLLWNITANFSRNDNEIIELAPSIGVNSYDIAVFDDLFVRATAGSFYGDIYGTKFLRVKDQASPHYGKMILTGEGLPQRDSEITRLGNQQARGLIGVTNSFAYKSFGLSFLIDARIGGEIFSATNVGLQRFGVAEVTAPGGQRPDIVLDGVVVAGSGYEENTEAITQQQYWNSVGTLGNLGIGEANIYDATNVRLRNISLSYTLPKGLLGDTFQSAKASVTCNNVWMIKSHLNGIDPESVFATGTNAVGVESGAFPTMRSFLFSLSFGF